MVNVVKVRWSIGNMGQWAAWVRLCSDSLGYYGHLGLGGCDKNWGDSSELNDPEVSVGAAGPGRSILSGVARRLGDGGKVRVTMVLGWTLGRQCFL